MPSPTRVELLDQAHPLFAETVAEVILEVSKVKPVRFVCVFRSPAVQEEAYNAGTSHTLFGWHNTVDKRGDPAALACDIVDLDEKPYSEEPRLYAVLAIECRKRGLRTGLLFDLPENMKLIRQVAIDRRQEKDLIALIAPPLGRRGWDPLHIEPSLSFVDKVRDDYARLPGTRL